MTRLVTWLVPALLCACSAPSSEPAGKVLLPSAAPPTASAAPPAASAPPERGYTLVLIKTGPMSGKLSAEENGQAFAGHFSNMGRMAEAGQLVVAGPFGDDRHDPNLRGIFVLSSTRRAEAEEWAGTDPTTRAGVFTLEFHDLATSAPLAWALESDLAWRKRQEAEGRTPQPGEGARPYVLLTAQDGELACRELEPLRSAEGGVFLLGRLDGERVWAILDAQDIGEARERFAPQLENLGDHVLDEWFASAQLARMVELR